ncbi:MAG: hypothetical protein PWQ48_84 [Thermotogaceae bacterium]|nr:hypothetical protein [Thermotogaceae bacterium]
MKVYLKRISILFLVSIVSAVLIFLLDSCGGLVPLQITQQPQSQIKLEGDSASFSVSVIGGIPPYSYQWKKDGVNISGANSQSYVISNLNSGHTGIYSVEVTDNSTPSQVVISDNANLVVISRLQVVQQPQSQTKSTGEMVTFTVEATGGAKPYFYQWFKDDNPISGANSDTYTISNVQASDAGSYYVEITESSIFQQTVVSTAAILTVLQNQPPTVSKVSGPNGTITQSSVTFEWTGNDVDGVIVHYEYRKDNGSWISISQTQYTWSGYSQGAHTFEVRAQDDDGAYSNVIIWNFDYAPVSTGNVDLTGPDYAGNYLLASNESVDVSIHQYSGTLSIQSTAQKVYSQPEGIYWYDPHLPLPEDLSVQKLVKPSITSKVPKAIGDTKSFWVDDMINGGRYQITATLQAIGSRCEIWVENPTEIDQTKAQQLADEFDNTIYPNVTSYFYTPSDVNGDNKVAILCFDIQDGFSGSGGYIAGYFYAYDLFNYPDSNKMEIFYIDTYPTMHYPITDPVDVTRAYSTLAHEFQHMVSFNRNWIVEGTRAVVTWLDEGLSMAAEHIIYGVLSSRIGYFNGSSSIANGHSLLDWGDNGDVLANYSLSYLFLQYVRTQMEQGNDIFKEILLDTYNDYIAVENAIHKYLDPTLDFGRFMTYFRIALLLKEDSGYFGFKGDTDFDSVSPPLYAGTGTDLRGGAAILKSISGSFTEPGDQGLDIQYAGITY